MQFISDFNIEGAGSRPQHFFDYQLQCVCNIRYQKVSESGIMCGTE